MPDYLIRYHGASPVNASLFIGVAILLGGVGGLVGIVIINKKTKKYIDLHSQQLISDVTLENYKTEAGASVVPICITIGFITTMIAVGSGNLEVFLAFFTISMLVMSLATASFFVTLMSCVPKHLRGQASASLIIFTDIFGRCSAPFILGVMTEETGYYWSMVFNSS